MPVKRRTPKARAAEVTDVAWALLTDGPRPVESDELFCLECIGGDATPGGAPTLRGLWRQHGAAITEQWAEDHPGTRPTSWWRWDGPHARPEASGDEPSRAPPMGEQAAILSRLGLLQPGEAARLPRGS